MNELPPKPQVTEAEVPEGVRMARAAFLRDFQALFADPKIRGRFVLYHKDQRVAVTRDVLAAIDELNRLNIPDGEYFIVEVSRASEKYERVAAVEGDIDSI
jgi:hypothetical protein